MKIYPTLYGFSLSMVINFLFAFFVSPLIDGLFIKLCIAFFIGFGGMILFYNCFKRIENLCLR